MDTLQAGSPLSASPSRHDEGPDGLPSPFVSVVVPTYNRRTSLERLLAALDRQTYPAARFEVLVVDDGSEDGTVGALRHREAPYRLRVLQQPHQGPAAARNLGVEHARGTLIVFLDDDVAPVPALIATHVATHRTVANAVVIGPMSPPTGWPRPVWVRWEEEQLQVQYRALVAGEYECSARQFYTGNASLARARFVKAGGFDVSFTRAEDVELGYRLRDQGARFVFNPAADVEHFAWRSFDSWCRTPYQYGRFDVVMYVEKGHEALPCALREFHYRHPLNRVLARNCIGRPRVLRGTIAALRAVATVADRFGADRPGALALSGIFNLQYWQGVADALGGAAPVWRAVSQARAQAARAVRAAG